MITWVKLFFGSRRKNFIENHGADRILVTFGICFTGKNNADQNR